MAKANLLVRIINFVISSFIDGLALLLANLNGTILGSLLGYYMFNQWQTGQLLQREVSRAITVMGIEGQVLMIMVLFIMFFGIVGALIEHKMRTR